MLAPCKRQKITCCRRTMEILATANASEGALKVTSSPVRVIVWLSIKTPWTSCCMTRCMAAAVACTCNQKTRTKNLAATFLRIQT